MSYLVVRSAQDAFYLMVMRTTKSKTQNHPIPLLGRSDIHTPIINPLNEFFVSFDARTCERKLRLMSVAWLHPDSPRNDQAIEVSNSDILFSVRLQGLLRSLFETLDCTDQKSTIELVLQRLFNEFDIDSIEYTLEESLQAWLAPEAYINESRSIDAMSHFRRLICSVITTLHRLDALMAVGSLNKKGVASC